MKKIVAALCLFATFTAPAFAMTQGPYIGANVGQSSTDTFSLSKKTDTAFTLLAGYQFMDYVAGEIQYNELGTITDTANTSAKITGFSAAAVGILPLNEQWALTGKLGFASTKLGGPVNKTKSDVTYGLGAQWNVNRNWGVRANFDFYSIEDGAPSPTKAVTSVMTIGGIYRF